MRTEYKRQFIREICNTIRDECVKKSKVMPEDWDGIELRQYLCDQFSKARFAMGKKQKRAYDNSVATISDL